MPMLGTSAAAAFELGIHIQFCCLFTACVRLPDTAVALELSSQSLHGKIAGVTSALDGSFCLLQSPYLRVAHLLL